MSNTTKFNLKDYNTGQYSVETMNGRPVEIVHVDEKRGTIFGFYDDVATYWELDGSYYPGGMQPDDNDLVMRTKKVVVHVNITRNKQGKIDCYASTAGKPRVYRGSTLLKYVTVEIDD